MRGRWSWLGPVVLWVGFLGWYLVVGGAVAAFLTYSLGVLLGYSLLLPLAAVRGLQLSRVVSPDREMAGEPVRVELRIRFQRFLPLPWLLLRENWTGAGAVPSVSFEKRVTPWWSGEFRISYTLEGLTRGVHRCSPTELLFGDPFGWIATRRIAVADGTVTVFPRPALAWYSRLGSGMPSGTDASGIPEGGRSAIGSGLREYAPGDPLRSIHWKTTAKRGALHAREREPALDRRLVIVLDGGGAGRGPLFDAAVEAAAGLWLHAEENGRSPGFAYAGEPSFFLRPGVRLARSAWFARLAELTPNEEARPLAGVLLQLDRELPRSVAMIVVSARMKPEEAGAIRQILLRRRELSLVYVASQDPFGEAAARLRDLETCGCPVAVSLLPEGTEVTAYAVDNGA